MSVCRHCGGDTAIRNPKGICDHLYYPENCATCAAEVGARKLRVVLDMTLKEARELSNCLGMGEGEGADTPFTNVVMALLEERINETEKGGTDGTGV